MDCIVHGVAKSQTQLSNFHYLVINKMNEILYKFNATYHIIKLGFLGMEKLNYIYCFLLELLVYY